MLDYQDCSDPILNKLDQWYCRKFRENYTAEVEKEVTYTFKRKCAEKYGLRFLVDIIKEGHPNFFRRSKQIRKAGIHFCTLYKVMGILSDELNNFGGKTNDYLEPFIRHVETLKGFVENVRSAAEKEGSINDHLVDEEFVKYFGNMDKYTNYCIDFVDSLQYLFDYIDSIELISHNHASKFIQLQDVRKEVVHYINDRLFSKLMGSKKD